MTHHKSDPGLLTVLFGLKRAGKTSAAGALCEIEMARCLPLVIFDLRDDHLSLAARPPTPTAGRARGGTRHDR